MPKRMLLTGAGGFVAGSVIAQAGPEFEVHAVSRKPAPVEKHGLVWHTAGPLDEAALEAVVKEAAPQVIVHAGANASIDHCKAHPEEARLVNAEWTQRMCQHAEVCGAKLVYCSTDNIFDGTKGLYTEEDPANPVNTYGATKLMGEQFVRECDVPWVIGRISIVIGRPMLGEGNSFISRLRPALDSGGPVGVPNNEIRTPIDVVTLGRALLELAGNDWTGVIHLSGSEVIDRCELTRRVLARMGYDPDRVAPNDPTTIPGRDERPLDASLSNGLARRVLVTPMLNVDEAVNLMLAERSP